jgi:tryptophanyl-tRNA synthetase
MRILSGIQPSGTLHIGNYFGAMKPAIELQNKGETFLFIADYHSLTTQPNSKELKERVLNVALDFLACGIDPEKTVFFKQSDIPEVTELTWILNCSTSTGLLERCHSYKDKVANGFTPNNGLFSYPVLMAADILMYNADLVPVGKDQKQHLEVTRDIAKSFNFRYKSETFKLPKELIQENVAVVPGTDGQKMSKSYNNTIEIFGKQKAIRKKVMKIETDSKGIDEAKNPDNCNIIDLYKLFASNDEVEALADKYRTPNIGFGYGHAKQELFEKMWDYFADMRDKREELSNNLDYVEEILSKGALRAKEEASKTMDQVKRTIGLL